MALDEALLESTTRGEVPPTLRLYAWIPACLSLGYAQPAADVDRTALREAGWDWVRRPTGGRAILHIDELTYSITGPANEPHFSGGVLESYRRLSTGLLAALQLLGVAAQASAASARPNSQNPGPVCFEVPSAYELTVGGRKLVGSAQARRSGGVLQHGSLPLWGDMGRITRVLAYPSAAARSLATQDLAAHAATLEQVLGRPISWPVAAAAFERGFRKALGLVFVPSDPTRGEITRAEELLTEKYTSDSWTARI